MSVVALMLAQGAPGTAPPATAWNPSDAGANLSFSDGNLTVAKSSGDAYSAVRATLPQPAEDVSGHYFELFVVGSATAPFMAIGVATSAQVLNNYIGSGTDGWSYYQETGTKITAGVGVAYGANYTTGDVIGVLLRAGELEFFKNGVSQGVAFTGLTGDLYPAVALYHGFTPRHQLTGRFAASDFSEAIPTGAAAWDS